MRKLLYGLLLLMVAGCTTPPTKVDPCAWLPVITYSTKDTVATKKEILAYEIAREGNCVKVK